MKAFLFVFDQSRMSRIVVIARVDRIREVENWYAMFGNTMILASKFQSSELSDMIRQTCPELTFLISEIDPSTRGGWLPDSVWSFLNDPHPATAESA